MVCTSPRPWRFYDLDSCPRVLFGTNFKKGVSVHHFDERRTWLVCSRNITYLNFRDSQNKCIDNVKGCLEAASVPGGTRQQESGAELYSEDIDVMAHNSLVLLDKERLGRYYHLSNYPTLNNGSTCGRILGRESGISVGERHGRRA